MEKWSIKLLILLSYFAIVIGVEFAYREKLFQKSLEFIKEFQANGSDGLLIFFKIITEIGTQGVLIPLIVLTYLFSPLNKAYSFLNVVILSVVIDCSMKILYGNPRPFWVNPNLKQACDGGFGNPSGHAYSSSSSYLALSHIITDNEFFNKRIFLKIFVFFIFIALIIAILLSRLYLGVHSINQILYGSLLGISLYFLLFHILNYHSMKGNEFFQIFAKKLYIFSYISSYVIIIITILLIYFLKVNDSSSYDETLNKLCPDLKLYRKFNNDGLFGCLTIFALIGAHYGITFLIFNLHKSIKDYESLLYWNKTRWLHKLYITLIMVLCAAPLILMLIISGNSDLGIIFIFKVGFPYLVSCFGIYGLNIYVCFKLKIINPELISNITLNQIDISSNIKNNTIKNVFDIENLNINKDNNKNIRADNIEQ